MEHINSTACRKEVSYDVLNGKATNKTPFQNGLPDPARIVSYSQKSHE